MRQICIDAQDGRGMNMELADMLDDLDSGSSNDNDREEDTEDAGTA